MQSACPHFFLRNEEMEIVQWKHCLLDCAALYCWEAKLWMCSCVDGRAHQYVIFGNPGVDPSVTLPLPSFDLFIFLTRVSQCASHLNNSMKAGSRLNVILFPKLTMKLFWHDVLLVEDLPTFYTHLSCPLTHNLVWTYVLKLFNFL